ncbi:MAG: hypothetical protein K0U60_09785 [Actinomycetia bacterium]|nr:hypothetical protein [Actinomycetes bacterium]MCH9801671.1 hypothetical protein [Actinomycetes bacterium]
MTERRHLLPDESQSPTGGSGNPSGPATTELSLIELAAATRERSKNHRQTARRLVVATIATGFIGVLAISRIETFDVWSFALLALAGILAFIAQWALRRHRKSQADLHRAKTELQRVADTDALSTVTDQLNQRGSQ